MSARCDHIQVDADEEAKARLVAIVESSDDAIIGTKAQGGITSWNPGAERIYGYRAGEVIGRNISILAPPDRLDEHGQVMERVRQGGAVEHLETVRLTKDGRRIEVTLTLSPICAADGCLIGIFSIARDITERTRLEQLVRESEKRYHTQIEQTADAIVVHENGRFVYANCAALGLYGAASFQQLQQVSVLALVHPQERAAVRARMKELLEGAEIPLRECRLLRLDGRTVQVETSCVKIDYQGKPSIQVIARDISQRKLAEAKLKKLVKQCDLQRTMFETVLHQMPIGVLIAEAPSGRIIYHNEAANRIFRGEVPPLADHGKWHVYHPDGSLLSPEMYPMIRVLRTGERVVNEELKLERGDGTLGTVSVNAAPIRDPSGNIVSGVVAFSDITVQIAAAEELQQSEQRLKLALDAIGMGSCQMDMRFGTGVWNQQYFLLLGYPAPEADFGPARIAMWQDRIHPDDALRVSQAVEEARCGRTLCRSEHRILRADDGRQVWVTLLGRFCYAPSGEADSFIGVIFDVTEQKGASEKLRDSELRYRLLFETSAHGIVYHDADGRIIMANDAIRQILGMESQELLGKTVPELGLTLEREDGTPFPNDEIPCAVAMRTGRAIGAVVLRAANLKRSQPRWLSIDSVPLYREGADRPYQVYATCVDITQRKHDEEALRASEAKFRWLFESNLIAIFFWNRDGKIYEANQAFCNLIGCSPAECQEGGLNWRDYTPPECLPKDFAAVEEILANGVCKPYQKEFLHRTDGYRVPVLCAGARMLGIESEMIGFAIDLTELKRAEKAMRESERTLQLAIETTGLGTFDRDLVTGKLFWSDIAKRHFGLSPQAPVDAETFLVAVHPEDREAVERKREAALTPEGGGRYDVKYRTIGIEDGKERWISAHGQTFFNEEGVPIRLVGACLDITDIVMAETALKDGVAERLRAVEELHRQEQLLIRQGRLAALGEMIGNIAHQWRQPLNTLALIVQELPWYFDHGQFSKEYLDANVIRAMQVINHMSKTIDGFRNFFEPNKEKVNFLVCETLAQTVSIVEAAFHELKLEIEVHADAKVLVHGVPNEFSQVLLNLLMNAKDALLERKVVAPRVVVRLFREGGKAVLTIADNAGGISLSILDKIFDPYFTTKGPDKGTGIGLFMSKTIIEKNMNGTLSVRNTTEGAEFRIEV